MRLTGLGLNKGSSELPRSNIGLACVLLCGIGIVVAAFVAISQSVEAKPVCKDGYRIRKGELLSTPYCQDVYLAQVAREYGTRVSARTIMNNPNKKREICQFIGQDIRVKHICELVIPSSGPL